jgi:hypothetical protein
MLLEMVQLNLEELELQVFVIRTSCHAGSEKGRDQQAEPKPPTSRLLRQRVFNTRTTELNSHQLMPHNPLPPLR